MTTHPARQRHFLAQTARDTRAVPSIKLREAIEAVIPDGDGMMMTIAQRWIDEGLPVVEFLSHQDKQFVVVTFPQRAPPSLQWKRIIR